MAAQRVIDAAVQRHRGMDTVPGRPVEGRCRDMRAPRIHEAAPEVRQPMVGARRLRPARQAAPAP